MLGVEKGKVILQEYNKEWKKDFEDEKKVLNNLIGQYVIAIEHVGSTAIPGLAAKPIIDIGIAVKDLHKNTEYIDILKNAGYDFRDDNGEKGEYLFKKISNSLTTHFIHIVEIDSQRWENYILFKKFLLSNPDEVQKYMNLKKELSEEYKDDRKKYTEGKNKYISTKVQIQKDKNKLQSI